MYVARIDAKIVNSPEVWSLREAYEAKFGERFLEFNYADFPGSKGMHAGEMYKAILEKAIRDNKPYHVVSHRYDEVDH